MMTDTPKEIDNPFNSTPERVINVKGDLVSQLSRSDKGLDELFKSDSGVWEGYTIERHTRMVLGQFDRYFARKYDSPLLSVDEFRLMLALHDIGKPVAIKEAGDKSNQHEYTPGIMKSVLSAYGLDETTQERMIAVANQDFIGDLIKGRTGISDAADSIIELARKINVPARDLTELIITYYECDEGSYTKDAGGKESADGLFAFDRKNGSLQFRFEYKFAILKEIVNKLTAETTHPSALSIKV